MNLRSLVFAFDYSVFTFGSRVDLVPFEISRKEGLGE